MRRDLLALHVALFFSGAAGLVYQSSWTRLLHRVFGVGDLAVATVLATFFLGLGIGNFVAARYVSRVVRPARAYAILEVGVGLYALASLAIVPGLGAAYGAVGADASFATLTFVRFCFAALALLPPTILMGATLPVVAEASRGASWSRSVTAFYTTNTLGAVAGAGLAGFVLVPQLGTRATVVLGAVGSFIAAAIVLGVLRDARKTDTPAPDAGASTPAADGDAGTTPIGLAAILTFVAGGAALGSEVVWTRVLRIVVHGTTPAFAAMLVNYLLGIAVGALIARALSKRIHPATLLGASQTLLVVLTAVAMGGVPFAPRLIPLLSGQADTVPHDTWVIGLVSGALLFPLAIVLGAGLPATWSMIERRSDAGRGAALLLAANTLGGLVGSLAIGFFIVPLVGTEASLLGLATLNALVAAVALRHAAPAGDDTRALLGRVLRVVTPLIVLTAVFLWRPSLELRFLLSTSTDPVGAVIGGPGEQWDRNVVFLREGRNTTVTVLRRAGSLSLYNDGRPESGFSAGRPGFGPELVVLGGLPGVLSGQHHDAMVIGLGAGHTATMALATGFEHVRVIELEEGVVEASRMLHEARERPFPLDDPRAQLVVDDARNQLSLMPPDSLDAVMSQPSHPWLAGSSALYTREFFVEVDRALREDGVFGLWVNLFRMDVSHLRSVLRTLVDVFPHVRAFVVESSSIVLMASSTPRPFGAEQSERVRSADTAGPFFSPHGLTDARALLARQEMDSDGVRAFAEGGAIIEDDRPVLELEIASLPNGTSLTILDLDRALQEVPWMSEEVADEVLVARIEVAEPRRRALDRLRPTASTSAWVRGRLAEARGDVTGALAAYDEATLPESLERAAELRFGEGLFADLLRSTAPDGEPAEVALRAAISESPIAPQVVTPARGSATPLARFVVALADRGCEGATEARGEDDLLAGQVPEVAHVLFRCALERGDREEASRYEQLAWRSRTAQAAEWTRAGEAALANGNGGLAWMLFRRALRIYPTTTRAAIGLARLHQRDGRPDEARAVLTACFAATEGLDEARQRIIAAASGLGIELAAPESAGESASSASTAPPVTEPRD